MNEIRIKAGNDGWWIEAVRNGVVQRRQWMFSEVMAEMVAREFSKSYRTIENPLPIVKV